MTTSVFVVATISIPPKVDFYSYTYEIYDDDDDVC